MSNKKIASQLKKYQKTSPNSLARRKYFNSFEIKMIYRTTKTENPETTIKKVNKVLNKMSARSKRKRKSEKLVTKKHHSVLFHDQN